MGMNCAEDPFNMGMFYNSRCHSKWVCFHIPNTHIRASLYLSRPPGSHTHVPNSWECVSRRQKAIAMCADKIIIFLKDWGHSFRTLPPVIVHAVYGVARRFNVKNREIVRYLKPC